MRTSMTYQWKVPKILAFLSSFYLMTLVERKSDNKSPLLLTLQPLQAGFSLLKLTIITIDEGTLIKIIAIGDETKLCMWTWWIKNQWTYFNLYVYKSWRYFIYSLHSNSTSSGTGYIIPNKICCKYSLSNKNNIK